VLHLRVGEDLRQLVHRPGGHVGGIQAREPVGHGASAQHLAQRLQQRIAIDDAAGDMVEARIARQPRGDRSHGTAHRTACCCPRR
jgi:hypothetical protein